MLIPPNRGGRIWPRRNAHDTRFASTERVRTKCVFCCCSRFFAPLPHETADLPTQSSSLNSFIYQFFKDLPCEIAVFGFPFWRFRILTHTFLVDLPCVSSIFLPVRLTPIRSTFQGPSWAILGSSWGHFGPSWGRLGAILGHRGAVSPVLRPSWGHLGAVLGPSWSHRGTTSGLVIPSLAIFGPVSVRIFGDRPNSM